MQFRGLFIGINRYKNSYIPWLRCAGRDAIAMHALFSDTLGGHTTLLVDGQATRDNIEKEIKALQLCNEDDVVVLYFSGHGTDTHELVTFNTDRNDLTIQQLLLKAFSLIGSRAFRQGDYCASWTAVFLERWEPRSFKPASSPKTSNRLTICSRSFLGRIGLCLPHV